jgi:hypothetical protein
MTRQLGSAGATAASALTLTALVACGSAEAPAAACCGTTRWESRPIESPPSYLGSANNSADCSTQYTTLGFEPVGSDASGHPLFLYFVGTAFSAADASSYATGAAPAVTEAMARRGFVALSVQYDNTFTSLISNHTNQLACLFREANAKNLLSVACGLAHVDCDLGIATWGHSQGALVAHLAANYDPRVRAAWLTGYGGAVEGLFPAEFPADLSTSRVRFVNGEAEPDGTPAKLNQLAGFSAGDCPDDGRSQCLRTDGSGWLIVRKADCEVSSADHCWFDKRACTDAAVVLEPNWVNRESSKPFALERNADWVAETAMRP